MYTPFGMNFRSWIVSIRDKYQGTVVEKQIILTLGQPKIQFKNSLIIQEENAKKNHKRVVVLYVIKNHVNLHKL
jgi:hypothetical protein